MVFFDYNGNGDRDSNEPPVAGATIRVDGISATSDAEGRYTLRGVAEGQRKVQLTAEGFRYIALSLEAFQSLNQPVTIAIERDTRRDWGLMQGFLTLPFSSDAKFARPSQFGMTGMFDIDRREGFQRSYDPATVKPDFESGGVPPWTYDQHIAIDYCFPEGTEIRAAMPGYVTYVGQDDFGGLGVWICYGEWANYYNHNSIVLVEDGQTVARGQVIALSGNTGQSGEPHLHFALTTCTTPPKWVDPYRDVTDSASTSYWTKDNDPQYPPAK